MSTAEAVQLLEGVRVIYNSDAKTFHILQEPLDKALVSNITSSGLSVSVESEPSRIEVIGADALSKLTEAGAKIIHSDKLLSSIPTRLIEVEDKENEGGKKKILFLSANDPASKEFVAEALAYHHIKADAPDKTGYYVTEPKEIAKAALAGGRFTGSAAYISEHFPEAGTKR